MLWEHPYSEEECNRRWERWHAGWAITRARRHIPAHRARLDRYVDGWSITQWKAKALRELEFEKNFLKTSEEGVTKEA